MDCTPIAHPMVLTNPRTNRRSLYLSSFLGGVLGMENSEASTLIKRMIEHATDTKFTFEVVWRPGTVVVWDNRCTMHRGRPYPSAKEARDLRRCAVVSDGVA